MTRSAANGPWCRGQPAPSETAKPQVRGCLDADADVRSHWGHAKLAVGQPLAVVCCARRGRGRDLLVDRGRVPAVHGRRRDHGGDPGPRRVRARLAPVPSARNRAVVTSVGAHAGSGSSRSPSDGKLLAYFSTPRHDHPTLSVIADEIMSVHVGRALMFLLWLALGWLLVAEPESVAVDDVSHPHVRRLRSDPRVDHHVGGGLETPCELDDPSRRAERAHPEAAGTDPGGHRLDLARVAPLRPGSGAFK